ncbi:hypothetical protein [Nonomuraea bangladeshensis]|uniref:hypothetical protein n=1 Tax=Nonomuraea bangladeshensis TaxID=404385 RepID=UPI003C303331
MQKKARTPQVNIEIEGQTLPVVEHLYSLAYLARVFKVGESDSQDAYLTIDVNDAYDWLDENVGEGFYGDIAIYDISFPSQREPTLLKTLSGTRRRPATA